MTKRLNLRRFTRASKALGRKLLPAQARAVLTAINKLLLSTIDEVTHTTSLEELRTTLDNLRIDDTAKDLNALFSFLAQSLLISFGRVLMVQEEEVPTPQLRVKREERVVDETPYEEQKPPPFVYNEETTESLACNIDRREIAEELADDSGDSIDDEYSDREDEDDRKKCPLCPATLAHSPRRIRKHFRQDHTNFEGKLFKCTICCKDRHSQACGGKLIFHCNPTLDSKKRSRSQSEQRAVPSRLTTREESKPLRIRTSKTPSKSTESPTDTGITSCTRMKSSTVKAKTPPTTPRATSTVRTKPSAVKAKATPTPTGTIPPAHKKQSAVQSKGPQAAAGVSIFRGVKCPLCKKKLPVNPPHGISLQTMERHLKKAHEEPGAKYFRCSNCPEVRTTYFRNIQRHAKKRGCSGEPEFHFSRD